jgi:hypothetical protein
MKKILFVVLIGFAINSFMMAQQCINNPLVAAPDIDPAPLINGQGGTFGFNFQLMGNNYNNYQTNPIQLVICMMNISVSNGVSAIHGSYANKFNWTFDSGLNCFVGLQNQIFIGDNTDPSASGGRIEVDFVQTNPISCASGNNMGFNVNIQPPPCMNGINTTNDDHVSSFTCNQVVNLPNLTVTGVSVNENLGTAAVQVCISETTTSAVTVTLNTTNVGATSPSDFTAQTNLLVTIPTGQTCTTVNIPIVNDNVYEGNETFNVTLSNPSSNAVLTQANAQVTIVDNEPIPTLSINDITVNENNGTATLTVTLSGAADENVTFNVNTQNVTAVSGLDFTAIVGTSFTIVAGSTTVSITVNILDDADVESSETLDVLLSSVSSNATISDGLGTVTILDNDSACNAQAPVISN